MKNLAKILLASTVLLAGCNSENSRKYSKLTHEDFQRAKWIEVGYNGKIYSGYTEEDIVHGEVNWAIYKTEVAKRNGFGITKDGKDRIFGVRGNSILLPDLDNNGIVRAQGQLYVAGTYQRDMQSKSAPAKRSSE